MIRNDAAKISDSLLSYSEIIKRHFPISGKHGMVFSRVPNSLLGEDGSGREKKVMNFSERAMPSMS